MCLRLLNWPIQRQQRRLPVEQRSRVAIHTALPVDSGKKKSVRTDGTDLKFVRELFPAARSGPAIVCVSDDAWSAGIRPGMPLAEARSMAAPTKSSSETVFLDWDPVADQQDLEAVAELTRRFAPIVGLDESPVADSLLLDITGCAPLFGGEAALAEQLLRRLSQQALQCRVAISDSVATAWAFSHAGGHFLQASAGSSRPKTRRKASTEWDLPVVIIPPQQSETWLSQFPVAAARIPVTDVDVLAQLGILNLGQLLSLPQQDLPSRISAAAIRRLRQIRGVDDELITAIPEANPVAATWVSEFPATTTHEIQQVLEHLVEDIAEQLQRRSVGATRLTCRLKSEDNSVIPLIAEVVRPVQSSRELLDVLLLRLEFLRIKPTLSVSMRATVAPLPLARQQDLFSPSEHIEPTEELASVVNRISNRLGKQSLLTAEFTTSPVPENSIRLRSIIDISSAGGSIDDRLSELVTPETLQTEKQSVFNVPLRLLPQPSLIGTQAKTPMIEGFQWNGLAYVVASVTGPDRIQTDWWNDVTVHRDYYRVTTQSGAAFWIYADLSSGEWYLHGVFD
jgi:protein ImuB